MEEDEKTKEENTEIKKAEPEPEVICILGGHDIYIDEIRFGISKERKMINLNEKIYAYKLPGDVDPYIEGIEVTSSYFMIYGEFKQKSDPKKMNSSVSTTSPNDTTTPKDTNSAEGSSKRINGLIYKIKEGEEGTRKGYKGPYTWDRGLKGKSLLSELVVKDEKNKRVGTRSFLVN